MLSYVGPQPGVNDQEEGREELIHRHLHREGRYPGELHLEVGGRAPQHQPYPLRMLGIVPWTSIIALGAQYFSFLLEINEISIPSFAAISSRSYLYIYLKELE